MGVGYFLDTYAIYEIIAGNPRYEDYLSKDSNTSILNIAEIYYRLLREFGESFADDKTLPLFSVALSIKPLTIKHAMLFRLKNKDKRLSYADCIGYILAKENGLKFLTGDKEFKGLENVEFVK